MLKYKLGFIGLVILLGLLVLLRFQPFGVQSEFKTPHRYPMLITRILGNQLVFKTKDKDYRVGHARFQLPSSAEVRSDIQTTYQFSFRDFLITASPKSFLFYNQRTNELNFLEGTFEWKSYTDRENTPVYIHSPRIIVNLSRSGKIIVERERFRLWNYHQDTTLYYYQQETTIPSGYYAELYLEENRQPPRLLPLLTSPQEIFPGYPEEKSLVLRTPADTIINFNWRAVRQADNYIINIYSDPLRDNLLLSRSVETNNFVKNLIEFIDIREFYWEIIPYDAIHGIPGIPSEMGVVRILGSALNETTTIIKPTLAIQSTSVSNRVVTITGRITPGCQLFIDDEPVDVSPDGEFSHRIRFSSRGTYNISFRVLSPYNVETKGTRSVTVK